MIFAYLILVLIFVPFAVGLTAFCFSGKPKKISVILFHRISNSLPKSLSEVSTKKFEKFCKEVKENKVCIAFDDGHKSVFDLAFPILKKYNLTATAFVASGIISDEKIDDFYSTKDMMSAENLKELSENSWEIASHSVHHLDLTLLNDNDLRKELEKSKYDLEKLIGKPVKSLSFPYGSWNEKVIETAKNCGYEKFIAYRKHKGEIIPTIAIFPFDDKNDMKNKISGEIKGLTKVLAVVIPHFAKGTPVFFWNKLYNFRKTLK